MTRNANVLMGASDTISTLLADVDGTLVTKAKVLTKGAIEAVRRLHESGIAFFITSGRPPRGMRMLIEPLGLKAPMAAFNGGMIVRPDLSVVDERPLPDDIVPDVINTLLAHGLDVWHVSAARSQPYYLDVTHPTANKGTVIERLSQFLNVPLESIATIGDQPNDVLMFKPSGLSIAMGNASPEVQRQADYVTTSYEDEGFANAVERFVLPRAALRRNQSKKTGKDEWYESHTTAREPGTEPLA